MSVRPHAAWLREGDPLTHATAPSSDVTLCGCAGGEAVRHLFEDVAPSRRCPTCEAASGHLREYRAIVWPSTDKSVPGKRIDYWAVESAAALASLRSDFGVDAHFTLWNEDDTNRPR